MQTDVTIVYQNEGNDNNGYQAFHIKRLTSNKLQEAIESSKIMSIDHIIVYESNLIKDTHKILYGENQMVDFFKEWKVNF